MRNKGYTNYAVALSAAVICEAVCGDTHTVLPVSTLADGFRGVRDVCPSLPCVVGRAGVEQALAIDLNDEEAGQFRHSASVLRAALDRIGAAWAGPGVRTPRRS